MERIAPWHQTQWDWRAAGNFIGGGTGSGLAIAIAIASAGNDPVPRAACVLSAFFIAAGLSLVWIEIGRPWRFLHVFFHPQTSWMTREALVAPFLLLSLLAAGWYAQVTLAALAALLALAFLYSQARILMAAKGIPAWREPRIVPLIVATGMTEGAAVLLLLAPISNIGRTEVMILTLVLLLVRSLSWASYRSRILGGSVPRRSREAIARLDRLVLLGNGLAMALVVAALAIPFMSNALAPLAALLALLGGWSLKFVLVTRAAFNQGFSIPNMPVRRRVVLTKQRPTHMAPSEKGGNQVPV